LAIVSGGVTPGPGAIEVDTSFFALAIFLYFFDTQVVIDDVAHAVPWGTHTFPVQPGQHRVRVSHKYFGGQIGANTIDVTVAAGQQVSLRYRAPCLIFLKGKLTVTGTSSAPDGAAQ
jgi:hypothetical protein